MYAMTQILSTAEVPSRPRRKKVEVPVHGTQHDDPKGGGETFRKTYSANFNSKRYRHKPEERVILSKHQEEELQLDTVALRVSRRHLSKENARLSKENEEVVAKFNELEELSVRKITKLKERISALQNANAEVSNENSFLREQTQDLVATIDDLKVQLELSKYCKNCDDLQATIQKYSTDNNQLRTAKKDLDEDVNMLKTVVYRLNLQLERYQEKLRSLGGRILPTTITPHNQDEDNMVIIDVMSNQNTLPQSHDDHTHTPISWGKVNTHTLGPLLDAYQDTIHEKDEIIASYEVELSKFTGRLKEIIKENEQLHKSLTEDDESSSKLKVEVEKLGKELQGARSQNDILIKKCAVKQDKLEEVLRCYETKVDQMKRDYNILHEQYFKTRTEVAALREKNKALIDAQDDFKNERHNYIPVSVHTSSVNECKKWYEELKSQYEQERSKLKENLDAQSKLIVELKKEKDELEAKVKQLEKHIKKGESKYLELEHTLNEVQLSRSACRKQLHKSMNFARDLVTEQETLLKALNQKQLENKAVKKLGIDVATRMDSLRNQLKEVQKDAWQELTTVEKRIQDQNDVIETMKQEHSEEIERLQQLIKDQGENNLLIKEQPSLPTSQYLLFRDKHK